MKSINTYPICIDCKYLIQIKSISIYNKEQLSINYTCKCKQSNRTIPVNSYYKGLHFLLGYIDKSVIVRLKLLNIFVLIVVIHYAFIGTIDDNNTYNIVHLDDNYYLFLNYLNGVSLYKL